MVQNRRDDGNLVNINNDIENRNLTLSALLKSYIKPQNHHTIEILNCTNEKLVYLCNNTSILHLYIAINLIKIFVII